MNRALLTVAVLALATASCSVNEYCINCAVPGDGGGDSGDDADAADAGIDAPDAGPCAPTNGGVEICDKLDNDCDGSTDNGTLPGVGEPCDNLVGECAGGVKQCTNGAIVCSRPPMAEICDDKDNNCNGAIDDGDPGGGGSCGTNAGECTAGVKHCIAGAIDCVGDIGTVGGVAEACNGKDDDCDTMFDEGLMDLGSCGGPNVGLCHTGTLTCMGGGPVCGDSPSPAPPEQGPVFELCDGADNDCDTRIDEDYNLQTDPRNCNVCGTICAEPHANMGCAAGACVIASCQPGWHNLNGDPGDGCEYGGPTGMGCFIQGAEVCNGDDDDCNGTTDLGITAPAGLCKTVGECTGSFASCAGANGWKCNYPSGNVTTDAGGSIVAETRCDSRDNDCDTQIDENQPNKGEACSDGGIGACQGSGNFTCDATDLDGPAVCTITTPGAPASAELCDARDNNCDGIVDNTTGPARVIDAMSHVVVGALDYYIDTHEASHPDATAMATGVGTTRACSNPGVIPWRNVSYTTAKAACAAAGKVLCSGSQWQTACEGVANTTYPYGNTFGASSCNTETLDGDAATAGDQDVLLATGAVAACTAAAGPKDMSGNLREWTDDITGQTSTGTNIAVLRGGGYETPAVGATCDFRLSRAAVNILENANGFRCCRATAP
ncbi:MAG: SUMF1/EgtB/PvdO family nonheme iron enzyme [Deltaproteobacteria bacterium]|nr:SUMF1/EgtB/PvdO family nonheme iron enzyme [Deltaproteobacteria bacterium]